MRIADRPICRIVQPKLMNQRDHDSGGEEQSQIPIEMQPRISVIMPVRDGARWLGEAIASITAQTLSDLELIVIDDGSVDQTAALVEASARADARVRLFRQGRLGLVAALNCGLTAARGALIARMDADDRSAPQRLQRQSEHLRNHPEIGLLGSWAERIDADGAVRGVLKPAVAPDALAALLSRTNPFVHSSVMVRAAVLCAVGLYRPAFEGAEDYDLWLRVAEVTQVANLPECLLQYRWHSASATHRAGVRQLFSTRLAQRAARERSRGGNDPTAGLATPPDWRASQAESSLLYGDLVPLFRLLELADRADGAGNGVTADLSVLGDRSIALTHAERRMAQLALLNLLRQGQKDRAKLLSQFVRLHPLRALKLAYRALRDA
jgi:Glycosyl transferase family 2